MASIAIGHGIKHWYIAAFPVFLPLLENEYALTTFGIAVLVTIRELGSGLPNFFVGYVSDRLRNFWHILLPTSLVCTAGAYMLAGLLPWYWPVVGCIALAGAASSFWHPPAISMLSTQFPMRRGLAIAFHGAGSGAGQSLGPLAVGFILVYLLADDWRLYVLLSMVPATLLGWLLFRILSAGWRPNYSDEHIIVSPIEMYRLLRQPIFLNLVSANMMRSFAQVGLLAFLPLYLARDLGMNSAGVGVHIALLTFLGIPAGPVYGYLSDRIGRRIPVVIAIASIGIGMFTMGILESGTAFTVTLGLTGVFFWSVMDVMNAAALDAAPKGTEGTVVGLMFASGFVAGVLAPITAGMLVALTGDRGSVFFVSSAIMLPAALLLIFGPLQEISRPT